MIVINWREGRLLAALALCACNGSDPSAPTLDSPIESDAPDVSAASPVVRYSGFSMSESVLYDADNDRYLVSNINGMDAATDNGFISVLSPDGEVTELKWIEGGKNGVVLNAPTGATIVDGVLYVADTPVVRRFDLATGAPLGGVEVPGITVLNDLAADPEGNIYVTDSGFRVGAGGMPEPTGTDAVFVIKDDRATLLVRSLDLHMPNGIEWTDQGLVVCATGAAEVYRLDAAGTKQDVTTTPGARLDGIVSLGDTLLVTSHAVNAVLRGKLGGTFEVAIPAQPSPANISYDTKRGRVLVPQVLGNEVDVYELK